MRCYSVCVCTFSCVCFYCTQSKLNKNTHSNSQIHRKIYLHTEEFWLATPKIHRNPFLIIPRLARVGLSYIWSSRLFLSKMRKNTVFTIVLFKRALSWVCDHQFFGTRSLACFTKKYGLWSLDSKWSWWHNRMARTHTWEDSRRFSSLMLLTIKSLTQFHSCHVQCSHSTNDLQIFRFRCSFFIYIFMWNKSKK